MTQLTPIIEIQDLTKTYNRQEVLNIAELTIYQGDVIGLVGNNGAGKTTLFSLILDLIKATTGWVRSKGVQVSATEEWKQYTSAYLDEHFLINFLTPEEYFMFVGKLHGWSGKQTLDFVSQYDSFFHGEILGSKKYIRDLSKGNQKKVGIIGAFIGDPELVILDEPFAHLDPSSQIQIKSIIAQYTEHHTFIVSSHDILQVTEISNRILLLEKGRLLKNVYTNQDTIEELSSYFRSIR